MNANGNDVVQLTHDEDIGAFNFSPGWSPDGGQIVFAHERDGTFPPSDIHVMNRDGSGRTNITQTPEVSEFLPDWGPAS
jgi:Tol biopolymer transport system component